MGVEKNMSYIKKHSDGFLLFEVLVACSLFAVMVSVIAGFINVWIDNDSRQRCRNNILDAISNSLERGASGLVIDEQQEIKKTIPQIPLVSVHQFDVQTFFVMMPQWIISLKNNERPVISKVSAVVGSHIGKQVKVEIIG
jgi:hypothetical protein